MNIVYVLKVTNLDGAVQKFALVRHPHFGKIAHMLATKEATAVMQTIGQLDRLLASVEALSTDNSCRRERRGRDRIAASAAARGPNNSYKDIRAGILCLQSKIERTVLPRDWSLSDRSWRLGRL